jgi:hypothetical protein
MQNSANKICKMKRGERYVNKYIYTSKNGIFTMTEFMQYLQYIYKGNKAIFCMSIIHMYIHDATVFFTRDNLSIL